MKLGLRAVAELAGVSLMTVSRVIRNSPQVSIDTRRKVEAAATQLGYTPDPEIMRLMSRVRGYRRRRSGATIAVIRDQSPEDELHDTSYQYVTTEQIIDRASRHGYRVETFQLGGSFSPQRIGQILKARGIEGIIISPQSSRKLAEKLSYRGLASVTFGYGLQQPALHRVSTNMTQGILLATSKLRQRGYRRIGLAITQWINDRADHTYSGAMLYFQQSIPATERVPVLLFPTNDPSQGIVPFSRWMRKHRPDAIISLDRYIPEWITQQLGLRIPEDVALVAHDWNPGRAAFAGIDHRRAHVAAAAVDLLATQLMQNERGVPEVPRQILIPPTWVEGLTVLKSHR